MNNLLFYFLQVVVCSCIFSLYYITVLKDKQFHQYNRFYLLGSAIISWIIPFIKIPITTPQATANINIPLYAVIASNNTNLETTVTQTNAWLNTNTIILTCYLLVVSVLLIGFIHALYKIYSLLQQHSYKHFNNVYLVQTKAKGTPFSFFKFIFWNTDIDLQTQTGKQILQHELIHIAEKHSTDKMVLQLITMAGWFNPFFWYIKKEVHMIHEFIADNKTVANGNAAELAQMLLTAAYPTQHFALGNPFFYSPIKRRITMLTQQHKTKFSYARRLIILPLLALVIVLFAFRKKENSVTTISLETTMEQLIASVKNKAPNNNNLYNCGLSRTYTVVVDAGHGGHDNGAIGVNGDNEKTISLAIAKLVKTVNTNATVKIVLLRDEDVFQSPVDKVELVNKYNADAFVSIHCNSTKNTQENGLEIYIPTRRKTFVTETNMLASTIGKETKDLITFNGVKQRNIGIWVLEATTIPAVLVECGFISNRNDATNLSNPNFQEKLATQIMRGIEMYLYQKDKEGKKEIIDTTPIAKKPITTEMSFKIAGFKEIFIPTNVEFVKNKYMNKEIEKGTIYLTGNKGIAKMVIAFNKNAIKNVELLSKMTLDNGKIDKEFIKIQLVKDENYVVENVILDTLKNGPLYIVDGVELTNTDALKKLNPESIESVEVIKNEKAVEQYGNKGKNGVINIKLKNLGTLRYNSLPTDEVTVMGYKQSNANKVPTAANLFIANNSKVLQSVNWNPNLFQLRLKLINGIEETYYTNNPEHVKIIEEKYGKLPQEYLGKTSSKILDKDNSSNNRMLKKNEIIIGSTTGTLLAKKEFVAMQVPKKMSLEKLNNEMMIYIDNKKSSIEALNKLSNATIKHTENYNKKQAFESYKESGTLGLIAVYTK